MPGPSAYYAPHPAAAAKPRRVIFDPWNSSSTGHQRADNNLSGSTAWRASRTVKLAHQLSDNLGGTKRMHDGVGAGSASWKTDGRLENGRYVQGASGLRVGGQMSISECIESGAKRRRLGCGEEAPPSAQAEDRGPVPLRERKAVVADDLGLKLRLGEVEFESATGKMLFRGLTIYINGSTMPAISDYKLKRVLVQHGANLSLALGRLTVTHVILGAPNGGRGVGGADRGSGGGLAASKIEKEIKARRGCKVSFVSVDWIVESLKAGKRLPEARFAVLKLARKGQGSVRDVFLAKDKSEKKETTEKTIDGANDDTTYEKALGSPSLSSNDGDEDNGREDEIRSSVSALA